MPLRSWPHVLDEIQFPPVCEMPLLLNDVDEIAVLLKTIVQAVWNITGGDIQLIQMMQVIAHETAKFSVIPESAFFLCTQVSARALSKNGNSMRPFFLKQDTTNTSK